MVLHLVSGQDVDHDPLTWVCVWNKPAQDVPRSYPSADVEKDHLRKLPVASLFSGTPVLAFIDGEWRGAVVA
jgi:hypothetical protein